MTAGKMDDVAAARIRKARGAKDDFTRRAAIAAQTNQGTTSTSDMKGKGKGSNSQGGRKPT